MFASIISRMFSKISWVKEAWDWFSFANDAADALGLIKRGAAAAAASALIAAPIVYSNTSSSTVQAAQPQVVQTMDDRAKVYNASYLIQPENKELLNNILAECRTRPDAVVERCNQAGAAADYLNAKRFTGKHSINF